MAQLVKNPPAMQEITCNDRDLCSIPGSGRSPGEGNGNPLQYPCLGNLMDRGAWRATLHGVTRVRHDGTKPPNHPHVISPVICVATLRIFRGFHGHQMLPCPSASLHVCRAQNVSPSHPLISIAVPKQQNIGGQNQAIF